MRKHVFSTSQNMHFNAYLQKLSLKDEAVFFEVEDTVSECQNMDELLENCSRAVTNEISTIKVI